MKLYRFHFYSKIRFKKMDKSRWLSVLTIVSLGAMTHADAEEAANFLDMSLEDLMQIEVTSVARRSQVLSETSAAIYVLTADDIANSTAVTIPDLLRTVPGMEVAQLDANKWAVSARGFNSRLVGKLMVIVDGRTVYSPTYGAVFWESLDLFLENIERIEVIRGPGATIWGANAVNGVVSITTKSAHDTKEFFASMLVGNQYELIVSVQQGGALSPDSSYRVYGKSKKHDGFDSIYGFHADDDWDSRQVGFRIDASMNPDNVFTFQGDFFDQEIGQRQSMLIRPGTVMRNVANPVDSEGMNILGRWERRNRRGGTLTTQFYYDYGRRQEIVQNEKINTYDLDITYTNTADSRHRLTLGGGIRYIDHDTTNTPYFTHIPEDLTLKLYSLSFHDDFRLSDRLILGMGLKIENNIYTGTEYQPNVRLNYALSDSQNVWLAFSRAVKTPSRGERQGLTTLSYIPAIYDPVIPVDSYLIVQPNKNYEVEELESFETGWRWNANKNLSFDIAAYYNQYDELRNLSIGQPYCVPDPFCMTQVDYVVIPSNLQNSDSADTWGFESVAKWQRRNLSFELGYSYFEIDYRGATNTFTASAAEGLNPAREKPLYKYNLQSNWEISSQMRLNFAYRYVSEPGISDISDYHAFDLQLVWEPTDSFSLRLVGRNLDSNDHVEFGSELNNSIPALIERSLFVDARIHW